MSHRSILLNKNMEHYRKYFPDHKMEVDPRPFWPTHYEEYRVDA
jgi:hypothetical protein